MKFSLFAYKHCLINIIKPDKQTKKPLPPIASKLILNTYFFFKSFTLQKLLGFFSVALKYVGKSLQRFSSNRISGPQQHNKYYTPQLWLQFYPSHIMVDRKKTYVWTSESSAAKPQWVFAKHAWTAIAQCLFSQSWFFLLVPWFFH